MTQAAQRQVGELVHMQCSIGLHRPMVTLVEKLRPLLPASLQEFNFWNSGTEAVEAALKLARMASGKQNIIAAHNGFHGRTYGSMSITTSKTIYREGFGVPLGGIYFMPFPGVRGPMNFTVADALGSLEEMLHTTTGASETAAVILEPVQGEGGFIPAPAEYLRGVREICDRNNLLLIFDEVQCGYGRTGTLFNFEQAGVVPDILIMAKGLANGFPLSGIVTRKALSDKQAPGSMGGTYSGNAVSCAAAVAVAEAFAEENVLANCRARGEQLRTALNAMKASGRYPIIDVRGPGLMVGLEFDEKARGLAKKVSAKALDQHLILLTAGARETVRFIPPLNITEAEMNEGLEKFTAALDAAVKA